MLRPGPVSADPGSNQAPLPPTLEPHLTTARGDLDVCGGSRGRVPCREPAVNPHRGSHQPSPANSNRKTPFAVKITMEAAHNGTWQAAARV